MLVISAILLVVGVSGYFVPAGQEPEPASALSGVSCSVERPPRQVGRHRRHVAQPGAEVGAQVTWSAPQESA